MGDDLRGVASAVRFGANVQPGQIVDLYSEPGKEPLARAVAEQAYRFAEQIEPAFVFAHSVRSYLYAREPASRLIGRLFIAGPARSAAAPRV